MKILALNPFHGGSHQAFLETWMRHSRHEFETLTQPATRWKWRMRQSAVKFAAECSGRYADGSLPDALFTTDMLSLAEFRGLCPCLAHVPVVVYFHENQLTYPVNPNESPEGQRWLMDMQPAFSNFCSAVAATQVWFNSEYHRQAYLTATREWLSRMPDGDFDDQLQAIESKSCVQYPPVELLTPEPTHSVAAASSNPRHIVWVGRWEHDKRPDIFFAALRILKQQGFEFRLSVLGEVYEKRPQCFEVARGEFADNIEAWGYQESRADYQQVLLAGDLVVSTAVHEFFGIAIIEAVSAGCLPIVPNALAYPEVLGTRLPIFHDGSAGSVAAAIRQSFESPNSKRRMTAEVANLYGASHRAVEMDKTIENIALH